MTNFYDVINESPLAKMASVAKSLNTPDARSRRRILLWLVALKHHSAQISALYDRLGIIKHGLESEGKCLSCIDTPVRMTLAMLGQEIGVTEDLIGSITNVYAECRNHD